jgi:hypothetical protein
MFTSKYFRPTGLNPFAIAAAATLYYLLIKSIGRATKILTINTVHECLYIVSSLFILIALVNFFANLVYSENEWQFLERNVRAQLGPIEEEEEEEEEEASYSETDEDTETEEEAVEEDSDSSDSEWLPYKHRKGPFPSPPRREKNPEMFLPPSQVAKDVEDYHLRYRITCHHDGAARPTSHVGLFEKDAKEMIQHLTQMTGFEFHLVKQE